MNSNGPQYSKADEKFGKSLAKYISKAFQLRSEGVTTEVIFESKRGLRPKVELITARGGAIIRITCNSTGPLIYLYSQLQTSALSEIKAIGPERYTMDLY